MLGQWFYPLSALLGITFSAWAWERFSVSSRSPTTEQRHAIFFGSLVGLAVGAKLAFLCAEGWAVWHDPALDLHQRFLTLLQGRSVTGALLGGYLGVELGKRSVGY